MEPLFLVRVRMPVKTGRLAQASGWSSGQLQNLPHMTGCQVQLADSTMPGTSSALQALRDVALTFIQKNQIPPACMAANVLIAKHSLQKK